MLAAVLLAAAPGAQAAGPPTFGVNVVNPATAPVPVTIQGTGIVTGNVAVTNTPSVNVANEVSARIVAMPVPTPYVSDRHLSIGALGDATSVQGQYEEVDDGIRVLIEYVSFYCTTRPGDSMLSAGIGVEGVKPDGTRATLYYRLPLQKAAADSGGLSRWHASQAVRLYANPGHLWYELTRTGGGDFWACDMAVSGQEIALP
jgi:hypothetical protein